MSGGRGIPRVIFVAAIAAVIIGFLPVGTVLAELKVAGIFGDNMVLQHSTEAAIWGWADPGQAVAVCGSWSDYSAKATAGADGKWLAKLPTAGAGGPHTVKVTAGATITLSNVMLGEVWLCGGQSNMMFPLAMDGIWADEGTDETHVAEINIPTMRLFSVNPGVSETPVRDVEGYWSVCSPRTAADFSAVGYFFGRRLSRELGVPIGLISASYSGTVGEAWTSLEALKTNRNYAQLVADYEAARANYSASKAVYDKKFAEWVSQWQATQRAGRTFTVPMPKPPVGRLHHNAPASMYNGMISPLTPMTFRGTIWYQGESNYFEAAIYEGLLTTIIGSWRKAFDNPEMPFYFVQIAPNEYMTPEIREAQRLAEKSIPHTGMVVTLDVGDCVDIHPQYKKPVGERLAGLALAKTYGKNIVCSGPKFRELSIEGGRARIHFEKSTSKLVAKSAELAYFTIAGADSNFVSAKAWIDGNTVLVESKEVPEPVAVRYAWENCPEASLFNEAGLPASPFRSDDGPWLSEKVPTLRSGDPMFDN